MLRNSGTAGQKNLAEQAKGPVQASVEMNNTPGNVIKTLNSMTEYIRMFQATFPGQKSPVTLDDMAAAIETFEAALTTPHSRFDKFLRGEASAMNDLRNIELTAPYFHSGKIWKLEDAVAIMDSAQLGITLTDNETKDLVHFLKATTGEQPAVSYPILPKSTNSTPLPVLN